MVNRNLKCFFYFSRIHLKPKSPQVMNETMASGSFLKAVRGGDTQYVMTSSGLSLGRGGEGQKKSATTGLLLYENYINCSIEEDPQKIKDKYSV